jgi:serine/threonine protein kinase
MTRGMNDATSGQPPPPDPDAGSREDRLNHVLLAYVEAWEAGERPNRDEVLAAHPDLREDLALFFSQRDRLASLRSLAQEVDHEPARASQVTNEGRHEITVPEAISGQLGDFRLIREIGRGGMGTVYEAEQISLNRRVALKILPFASALDPRQLQRFKNEAAAAANLRHENIVAVHAVGSERGVHYFAMQFVEGQSLAAYIAEQRRTDRPGLVDSNAPGEIEPAEHSVDVHSAHASTLAVARLSTEPQSRSPSRFDWVARLGRQAALALEHAHQTGVVHRDVKPANLLLDTRGQLWVTDFGLAQVATDAGLTMTGELLGTLRYASPEQLRGRRGIVDHRSDIYSLGATLYELLTLRPPFDAQDRHELMRQVAEDDPAPLTTLDPGIPTSLATIVLKALRKDPADRYSSAQDLADDLERFLERRPILAQPPRMADRFRVWARRHPTAFLASAVLLLSVTLGSILIAVLVGAERERTHAAQQRAEQAFRAERLRAEEAESRLRLARRAVDELLVISEEELADRPEMLLLRKRVLRSALAFYQEFLSERRSDPRAKAELLETTERVEQILADLEILRSATHFYLLCQPAVREDLQISAEQQQPLAELTDRVGQEWLSSWRDIGMTSPAERARRTLQQARANEASLSELLTSDQQDRLRQIGLQSEGAAAFRDQEVAAAIGLSPTQRERIRMIEDDAAFGWIRGPRPSAAASESGGIASPLTADQRIVGVLTAAQVQKWRALTGQPIAGLFPLAPAAPQTRAEIPTASPESAGMP